MTLLRLLESWAEGLLRIVIGAGLAWIGVVEGAGYGAFLEVVGGIFIAAGIGEIWFVEFGPHELPRPRSVSEACSRDSGSTFICRRRASWPSWWQGAEARRECSRWTRAK